MSPETCAQYRSGAGRGPFPWYLRASRLAGESLKVVHMKSVENQTIRFRARARHP